MVSTTSIVSTSRFPFTAFPDGVYAVAFSHQLKVKQVISLTFMGEKLALFRSGSGEIGAIQSYCPHLGADLAFGTVSQEALQCPFHGLQFQKDGKCLKPHHSSSLHLKSWQAFEKYGLIFLIHDVLDCGINIQFPDWSMCDWGTPRYHHFKIKSHPQEILENSVDQLHFYKVHQYQNVKKITPFQTSGSEFWLSYVIERPQGLFQFKRHKITFELSIHAYGLGMSMSEINIPQYQMKVKQLVFPTPIDGEWITIRTLTSACSPEKILFFPKKIMPSWIKKSIANYLTGVSTKAFLQDFLPDLHIWENKKYIQKPAYLPRDGEFDEYRKWASQFYRLDVTHQTLAFPGLNSARELLSQNLA